MTDELKALERQHRIPIGFKLAAFLLICYGFVGTQDYNIAKAAEKEHRAAKKKGHAVTEPARIYSNKCMRQGKRIIATQADGGVWRIRCVDAEARLVKA